MLLLAAFYLFMYLGQYGCIFRRFFGIVCPGCYMTRAILAALRLDFAAAFRYHPMFFTLPVIAAYIWNDGRLFKNSLLNYGILSAIGIGFTVCYIMRLNGLV